MFACALAHGSAAAATLTVCAAGCSFTDLQQALDAAQPGDTILLRAGETFVGHFRLPVKHNPSGAFIVVRSDSPDSQLPPAGTRLIPHGYPGGNTESRTLARLVGRGGAWRTTPVVATEPGAHHYRLQFLDIDGFAQEGWETLVQIGDSSGAQSSLGSVPRAITLDRVFIHGHPTKGQKRCVALDGSEVEVLNSYIVDCASIDFDSQAIGAVNGPGPYRIVNNYLQATGENVMFGGADPKIHGLVPSDIEIRRNHFYKPVAWRDPILRAPSAPSAAVVAGGGALPAGVHYFRIVAVLQSASEAALSAPSPERAVSLDSHNGAVTLTWSQVPGADRYRVYRGTSSGGQSRYLETAGAQTSFTYRGTGEITHAPRTTGTRWNVKNLLELKNAQRVLIDGNVFEHSWAASQTGYAIVLTPRNEEGGAPWSVVQDVTFSHNVLRHAAGGINILGQDDVRPSQRAGRISIRNNLIHDVSSAWGGHGHFLLMTRSPYEITVDHNTVMHHGMVVLVDDGVVPGFRFTNNVAPHNAYGIFGSGAGMGTGAISAYFPDAVVRRNALGGGPAALYPPDNVFPDMATFTSQFVNGAVDDYRLVSGSSFRNAGTDGRDLGVDFAALNSVVGGVIAGSGGGTGGGTGGGGGPGPGVATPFGGAPVALPGIIQAEHFDEGGQHVAYLDTTPGNSGGAYRNADVDIEATSDAGGGFNVGWMAPGEWLQYTVNVSAAGTYTIEARVAALRQGGTFHVEVNGVDITGPMTIPHTGGWQTWTTVSRPGVALSAGQQVWRLVIDSMPPDGVVGNINYLRVVSGGGTTPPGGSTPFTGTPVSLPGTIQAEQFDNGGQHVAYVDHTPGNQGGAYRDTDVDIAVAQDVGGGYTLGWVGAGEWLEYTVNVTAAGTYDIEARVASGGTGGTFRIDVNGVDRTGPITVPNTGGWQTWTTIRRTGVALSAGPQVWRVVMLTNGPATGAVGNFNYLRVASAASTPGGGTGGDIVLRASDVRTVAGNWARAGSWSGAGGEKMQSADRGWATTERPVAAPADYFEVEFTPDANRSYRIWLRLRAGGDSKFNDSVWVQFSGAVDSSGTPAWRIGSSAALLVNLEACSGCGVAGWGWHNGAWWLAQGTVVQFPSNARQTVRIQTREDGVEVDQIVLSPVTYFHTAPGGPRNDTTIVPKP